jgi:glycosyltransferase involved in cell wall biosynthesis
MYDDDMALKDDAELVKKSGLFDTVWYLKEYSDVGRLGMDPVEHYLRIGARLLRNPSLLFDTQSYLASNSDVALAGVNPLVHYLRFGIIEGRSPVAVATPKLPPSTSVVLKAKTSVKVKGGVNRSSNQDPVVRGWLAEVGNVEPRTAILKIDQSRTFEFICDTHRADLQKNKINEGRHAFEFVVPLEYVDGKKHKLELFDKVTGQLIASVEATWNQTRRFKDFSGFLADSVVSPVISAPFREEDKRCFAIMENIANQLSHVAQESAVKPLVSVIMPVHNRIDTVMAAVESVLSQTYVNLELIIVDDGSTDGSTELIEKMTDKRIVFIKQNCMGVSRARNNALSVSKGKYVAYLDSDNIWDARYLAATIGAFIQLTEANAVYSGQLLFRGDQKAPFAARYGSFNASLLRNRNYIDLNAFCHTREAYDRVGGFDLNLRRYVDWDLILRMSEVLTIYSIPVLLSHYFYDKATNTITNDQSLVQHLDTVRQRMVERTESKRKNIASLAKNTFRNRVSIVIPSYESLEDIKECIESILCLKIEKWIDIVVVDNASSTLVVDYLRSMESLGTIKLIANEENYGFTYAVNQGIAISDPNSDIVLLNNDAMLTAGSIEVMQESAYDLVDCGLVVPQQVLPGGTKTIGDHVPFANPDQECDVNLSTHHGNVINVPIFHNGNVVEISFAPFFCVYIKRSILNTSLGLDAEFGRHYRSDRIFCDYVRHVMKLKIYHVSKAVVYHKLQKSTDHFRSKPRADSDFDLMFRQNKWDDRLREKLGFSVASWDI